MSEVSEVKEDPPLQRMRATKPIASEKFKYSITVFLMSWRDENYIHFFWIRWKNPICINFHGRFVIRQNLKHDCKKCLSCIDSIAREIYNSTMKNSLQTYSHLLIWHSLRSCRKSVQERPRKSDASQGEKICFSFYHHKEQIRSFPTMYNTWGCSLGRNEPKKIIFSKKVV